MRRAALALALSVALGCGSDQGPARPQWVLTLRTDAPVPELGDRVLIEITTDDGELACPSCRRVFAASSSTFPLSLGVAASSRTLFVRARLFLARDASTTGAPAAELALDRRVRLPSVPGRVALDLPMVCWGIGSTGDATCDPATGALAPTPEAPSGDGDPSLVTGSYARVAPCGGAPTNDGMVCVDGGLFLFREAPGLPSVAEQSRGQLVRVSSFLLDRDELTVGRFRALFRAGKVKDEPVLHADDGGDRAMCSWRGADDPSADALSLDCLPRSLAAAICAADGARLPREAELAWVAGNGGRGTDYPWGASADACAHAVIGRGALVNELPASTYLSNYDCRVQRDDLTFVFGPAPAERAGDEGDEALGVRGLAGNLAEWVADDWATILAPCWRGRPYLSDPTCVTAAHTPMIRGGSWADSTYTAHARYRSATSSLPPAQGSTIGFRCARDL